jgi:hypothetical protein
VQLPCFAQFGFEQSALPEAVFAAVALEQWPEHLPVQTAVFLPLCDFEAVFVPSQAFAVVALRKRPMVRRSASLRMIIIRILENKKNSELENPTAGFGNGSF